MTCPPKRGSRVGWAGAALALAAVCACLAAACTRGADTTPALGVPAASAVASISSGGTVPHGDHNPHHSGLVLMNGDRKSVV